MPDSLLKKRKLWCGFINTFPNSQPTCQWTLHGWRGSAPPFRWAPPPTGRWCSSWSPWQCHQPARGRLEHFSSIIRQPTVALMHPIITSWLRFNIFFTNHSSTDLQSESCLVVSIGNSTLFDSSVGWQGSLGKTSVSIWKSVAEETMDAYLYIWMPRLRTILCVVIWRTILMVLCSFVNLEMMEINLKIELFCFHRKSLKTQPKRQVSSFYKRLLQISTKNA